MPGTIAIITVPYQRPTSIMHLKLPLLTAVLASLAYASPVQPGSGGTPTHSGGGPSTTHKMLPANDGAIIELLVNNGNCTVHFTDMFGCNGALKEPLGPFKDGQCHGKKYPRIRLESF